MEGDLYFIIDMEIQFFGESLKNSSSFFNESYQLTKQMTLSYKFQHANSFQIDIQLG